MTRLTAKARVRAQSGPRLAGAVAGVVVLTVTGCSSGGSTEMSQKPAATSAQASTMASVESTASVAPSTPAMTGLPDGAVVTYEFRDSSVPPPYHRSFALTFNQEQARMVVDSYGEVLADETRAMTSEAWDQVSSTFGVIENLKLEEPEPGCTGGTGFAVTVASAEADMLDVDGYVCGGVNGEANEEVAAWVAPVRSLFPPMSELAPDGLGG